MIFKNVRFWLHRQLFNGFIAISCLLLSADFETTDGTFQPMCLKLFSFDEFVDYFHGKSSLDKPTLLSVTNRLRDDAKHRRDYLQLKLRPVKWDECATEESLMWPLSKTDQDKFSSGSQWELSFATSKFASKTIHNWVDGDFLTSAMMFPLRSVFPYSKMCFCSNQCDVNKSLIFINLRDGKGYVEVRDYQKYLNRTNPVTTNIQTASMLATLHNNKIRLGAIDDDHILTGDLSMTSHGHDDQVILRPAKRHRVTLTPVHDPFIKGTQ